MPDITTRYHQLLQKVEQCDQGHIFAYWHDLDLPRRESLLRQIETIDFELMCSLAETYIFTKKKPVVTRSLEPVQPIPVPKTAEQKAFAEKMTKIGEKTLRAGKIGAILVAGGQGSRLGFDGPKGEFPIAPVTHKTLFQLHAEKLLAMRRRYGKPIPWYIMTSETNDLETKDFFENHQFFGLPPDEVIFFVQGMMPALNEQGKLILDAPHHIFMNPDGHGGIFDALAKSGAVADMARRGIEQLFYFQVDNVLINMCDPLFLGYHIDLDAGMSSKVCPKRDPFEKVGIIGKINGRLGVIEYSDLSDAEKTATDASGNLRYNTGSLAIHMLSRAFIEKIANAHFELPWHVAHKKVPYLDAKAQRIMPKKANGYKFEKFIFDALQFTQTSAVLEVERTQEFSPVKNARGEDSPATARRDLTRYFGQWLLSAGFDVPGEKQNGQQMRLEISALYALDAQEFAKKVAGKLKIDREFYVG